MLCIAAALGFIAIAPASFAQSFAIAKLQLLDKVIARVSVLEVKPNMPVSYGTIDINVLQCWRAGSDAKPEQAALIEITERTAQLGQSKPLFSGWMFASSPALSALEHPVYDVSLLECAL